MSKIAVSAFMAIVFGLGLACFETWVNWGQWQWWPFWLVDFVAAALLVFGGITFLKRRQYGAKLLSAGWGFTLAMMWMSLAGNITGGTDPERDARLAGLYVTLIIVSMILSLIGLLLALMDNRKFDV